MKQRDRLRDDILDAAIELATIHGISRMSVGDVAQRVGISRPTLYKQFGSKDDLVAAAVMREAMEFVSQVTSAAAIPDDPRAALHAGIVTALVAAREHPLLDRIVTTEPEVLLPFLSADGGPVLTLARIAIEGLLEGSAPDIEPERSRLLTDLLSRLLISYTISPPQESPEVVASTISSILFDGALAAGVLTTQESS